MIEELIKDDNSFPMPSMENKIGPQFCCPVYEKGMDANESDLDRGKKFTRGKK